MKIINLNNKINNKKMDKRYETAVALGNFDGIHRGHKYLIKDNILKSNTHGFKSAVLLFKNHTKTRIKNSSSNLSILTSVEDKLLILEKLGVELVYIIDFDSNIMELEPEDFIEKIIIDKLNSKLITIGFDYRFGYKAQGDSTTLKELGDLKGIMINIVEPISVEGEIVSSTIIRNLIKSGNIEKANNLLGRNYSISGTVIKGDSRGNKLGFPTANIKLKHNYVVPHTGVYKTITNIKNKKYLGLTSIGSNPTFYGQELKIENHMLNFNNNIYNKTLNIEFTNFIRDDIKFEKPKDLINQIKKDIQFIKES